MSQDQFAIPALQWQDICYDIPLPKKQRQAAAPQDGKASPRGEKDVEKGDAEGSKTPDHASVGSSEDTPPKGMRRILAGMSGAVSSGEMVAILGASGAGKTTLLNVISARLGNFGTLTGEVLFRGQKRNPKTWKRTLGFVEQEDLMYSSLTVEETLEYSAKLRLPTSRYTRQQKLDRAADVLDILRLDKCRNTKIGDGASRGVSGGERKRVSIGVELVNDVSVLMLDEPTSGLDSFAALNVIQGLKEATRVRKLACLMTIHQPSWTIFTLYDRVILLSRGHVFYAGPGRDAIDYFAELGYTVPEGTNPADYFITIAENNERTPEGDRRVQRLIDEWKARGPEFESETKRKQKEEREKAAAEGREGATFGRITTAQGQEMQAQMEAVGHYPISWLEELWILSMRNTLQIARDPVIWIASFASNIVLLIIIGFLFFRLGLDQAGALGRIGILVFIPTNTSFSIVFPILAIFPLQRLIMVRERSSGAYRTTSFFLAKLITEIPSQLAQRALYYIVVYWMMNLRADAGKYFIWLAVNFLQIVVTISLGLAIGASVTNIQMANIVAPMINIIFLLFAGQLLPTNGMGWWFRWIHYISPVSYAFMALATNELVGLEFSCTPGAGQCYQTGEDVLKQYNVTGSIGEDCGLLAVIGFVLTVLGYFALLYVGKPKWRFT